MVQFPDRPLPPAQQRADGAHFWAKLSWRERQPHTIAKVANLAGALFSAMSHTLDYDFIARHPDCQKLVAWINPGHHHWLNFDMDAKDKIDLFGRGMQAARDFLACFDWEQYKELRAHLSYACKMADDEQAGCVGFGDRVYNILQTLPPKRGRGGSPPLLGDDQVECGAQEVETEMESTNQPLPSGTITFLFTGIEGSAILSERDPMAMEQAVARHHAILHAAAREQGGGVFKVVGDAFQIAFSFPAQALNAALAAQRALAAEPWGATGPLRVRMGIHTGPAQVVNGDYVVSHTLHRVARIASAAHGGQILLSMATEELLRGCLPEGVQLEDLGEHLLKGLSLPERIFQVVAPDLIADYPALVSETPTRHNLPPQLLKTKLYAPSVRPDARVGRSARLVSRPRLVEWLNNGLRSGCKLTLISAPAGFGKTTLVSSWLSVSRCPAAWISLDSGDNDPARFFRYLIAALQAALQTVEPQVGHATERLLQSPQLPPLESMLTVLVNELCSLADQIVLVLDDYHLITAAEVHQAVTFLLEHLPPQVHVVLLTRADPPLPLTRLRARNQLVELRAAHLRFTTDEAATFLNQVMGLGLSAEDAAAMEACTEGWIAGLQLAAIALQSRPAAQESRDIQGFVAALNGGHYYIVDYLVEEVLDRQTDLTRSFLLQTSILERLSGPLCNAVTARVDGQAMLRALEQANLFVVPLDDARRWYRYHHLFAQVLRSHLQERYPDQLSALHRRAAEWCERNGLVSEALDHALAAGARDLATLFVESHARSILMRGELVTLERWLKALGPAIHDRPWMGIHQAWTLLLTGQMQGLERLLEQVADRIAEYPPQDRTERQDILGEIAAIRGLVTYLQGDALRAVPLCRQALESLREDNQVVRGIAAHALGEALGHSGDLIGSQQANARAARIAKASGSVFLAVAALTSQANHLVEQGRLHRAVEIYHEALQLAILPNGMQLPPAGRVYACLCKVFYEWNDLEAVTQYAQQGIDLCRQGGIAEFLTVGYLMLSHARRAQGDLDGAQEAVHEAEQLVAKHSLPAGAKSSVQACRVRLWLAQDSRSAPHKGVGDAASAHSRRILERAARWAEQSGLSVDDPVSYIREPEYIALLHVLLARGEPDAALTLVDRLLGAAEATGRIGRVILFLVLQALAWQAKEEIPRALNALERALALAQPEGYVRTFLDKGEPMDRLLRHAGSRGIAPAYVTRLLAELTEAPSAVPPLAQPLIEPLSERELQVLHLLSAGKSNQEIADELVLATGTVKRHLYNIFGKLNVSSRTQCAARARELGLL